MEFMVRFRFFFSYNCISNYSFRVNNKRSLCCHFFDEVLY